MDDSSLPTSTCYVSSARCLWRTTADLRPSDREKATINLRSGDTIVIRLRGDGREYNLNLYTTSRQTAFSYRATFDTPEREWIEVRLPLTDFVATSFGRIVENRPLNPNDIAGVGFLIADEKAGPFELEVDWMKVITEDGDPARRSVEP